MILYMLVTIYVGSITANLLSLYLNYRKGLTYDKWMEKETKEINTRAKALEEEIDRFNDHVSKLNMDEFSVDSTNGVKH